MWAETMTSAKLVMGREKRGHEVDASPLSVLGGGIPITLISQYFTHRGVKPHLEG